MFGILLREKAKVMSIASNFRAKMDVALDSAYQSRLLSPDARRTKLMQDLDKAGLILVEKSAIAELMSACSK